VIVICVGEFLSCNMIYLVYFRWAVSSIGTRLPDGKWSLGTPAFTAAVYTDILRYAEVVWGDSVRFCSLFYNKYTTTLLRDQPSVGSEVKHLT
jgi:hypothetical protein